MSETNKPSPLDILSENEIRELRENRGKNVTIYNHWVRHSQKSSGEVFNSEKTGISLSNISPGGAVRAKERGATYEAGKHGAKGYKSTSERTQETFDALMRGYAESNPDVVVREKVRIDKALVAPSGTPEFLKEYEQKWGDNKKELLKQGIESGKYPNVEFGKLTPDQQEEIVETAEEPVILEWIDNPESTMAKNFPPRMQAANFAVLFGRRHGLMAERLNAGSEADIFHNTHKTVTEAFLASGVLIRKSDNARITKLGEVGGSLKILDEWESEVSTNEKGEPTVSVKIRGQEYKVDDEVLKQLIAEGITQERKDKTLRQKGNVSFYG